MWVSGSRGLGVSRPKHSETAELRDLATSLSPPARSARRIFNDDSAAQQLVANAIRLREVARLSRRVAGIDQLSHGGIERLVAPRIDVEDRMNAQHRCADAFG